MRFKNLHSWNLSPKQAISIQNKLKTKIRLRKYQAIPRLIAGVDVAFKQDRAIGVVVVLVYPEFFRRSFTSRRNPAMAGKIIEWVRRTTKITYPYIPGLLTFREGPVLERCFRALKHKPQIIIFDGQGLAHPRNMGLATHLGILLDKPTIGCAKSRLWGEHAMIGNSRGAFSYLLDKRGKKLGVVLRTRDNVRPVYVSAGYKMDLASAIRIILMCTPKYRLPQPLRMAHQLTNQLTNLP